MVKEKVKELIIIKLEKFIKEIGLMELEKEKEFLLGKMVLNGKVLFMIMKWMVKVFILMEKILILLLILLENLLSKFYNGIPFMYCVCLDAHNNCLVNLDNAILDMKEEAQRCINEL